MRNISSCSQTAARARGTCDRSIHLSFMWNPIMFKKSKLRQSLPPNAFGLLPEMLFSEGRQRCDVTNG